MGVRVLFCIFVFSSSVLMGSSAHMMQGRSKTVLAAYVYSAGTYIHASSLFERLKASLKGRGKKRKEKKKISIFIWIHENFCFFFFLYLYPENITMLNSTHSTKWWFCAVYIIWRERPTHSHHHHPQFGKGKEKIKEDPRNIITRGGRKIKINKKRAPHLKMYNVLFLFYFIFNLNIQLRFLKSFDKFPLRSRFHVGKSRSPKGIDTFE